jgi:hypothetical protein
LASKWVWECEELGATVRRADVEALKSFLSKEIYAANESPGAKDRVLIEFLRLFFKKLIDFKPEVAPLLKFLQKSVPQDRPMAWSANLEYQSLFREVGLAEALDLIPSEQMVLALNNSYANKLDAYLNLFVESQSCTAANKASFRISLKNSVPRSGLPYYVAPPNMFNKIFADPRGTTYNQLLLYLPKGADVVDLRVDGEAASSGYFEHEDRTVLILYIKLRPGAESEVGISLSYPTLEDEQSLISVPPSLNPIVITKTDCKL